MVLAVAKSLTNILHNEFVRDTLDRTKPLKPLLVKALDARVPDLNLRNPRPAYKGDSYDGNHQSTDFDMYTHLKKVVCSRLVFNLPFYDEMYPQSLRSNEIILSKENRHGQAFKIISSNDTHSMSIRTKDYSIAVVQPDGTQEVGAWRHFSMVDPFGRWNAGWRSMQTRPTEELRRFIEEHKLTIPTGFIGPDNVKREEIHFEHFIHPNLAFSFYGSPYLTLKIIAQRMKDQADHYRQQAKEIREMGIKLPPPVKPIQVVTYPPKENGRKVVIPNIEAKVILPEFSEEPYPIYSLDDNWRPHKYDKMPDKSKDLQGVLRYAEKVAKELTYGTGASLRSEIRAVELAYRLHGFIKGHELEPGWEIEPGWDIPKWDREYIEPGKRIVWNALQLSDTVSLLYRVRYTSITLRPGPDYIYEESDVVLI